MSNTRPNPYPGPRPFGRDQSLYGRDQERRDLCDLLIAERIVLLYSPSGAGKTSLIQAALIPELKRENFRPLPLMRVGMAGADVPAGTNRYILSALQALEEAVPESQRLAHGQLADLKLGEYLRQQVEATGDGQRIVLIFDQFEEILTVDFTDGEAKGEFFRQVGQALRDGRRWALFSMREEFIAGLDAYRRFVPTLLRATFRLDLLSAKAALDAICRPSEDAGVAFLPAAAEKLVEDLRTVQVQGLDGKPATAQGPYVEPVQLQVVCRRLWEGLDDSDTTIDEGDVGKVGDVDAALAGYYADSVAAIAGQTQVRERAVRDWVERQLITKNGLRGQAMQGEGVSQGLDNRAINRLVDAHLVRLDRRRNATWFELTHDRLIAPIRSNNEAWREEHLSTLQRQAALWEQGDRPAGLLLQDQALVDAEARAEENDAELEPYERKFLQACRDARAAAEQERRRAERIRRLQLGIVAAIIVVLAIIALTGFVLYYRAEREAGLALSRQLAAQSASHLDDQYDLALLLALEAYRVAEREELRGSAWYDRLGTLGQGASGVAETAAEARGSLLVALEHNPNLVAFLKREHKDSVTSVTFNPRDGTLASGDKDGFIRLWTPNDVAASSRPLSAGGAAITTLAYGPDGDMLAAGNEKGEITLWSLAAASPVSHTVVAHDAESLVEHLAFGPDGQVLASIGKRDLALWRITSTGDLKPISREPTTDVFGLAFSPDGRTLATGHKGGQITTWSVADGLLTLPQVKETGLEKVDALAFSPGADHLAAAGTGSPNKVSRSQPQILLFDLEETAEGIAIGTSVEPLVGHRDRIASLAFSPDGKLLASGSRDNSVMIWRESGAGWEESTRLLGHHGGVRSLAFSPACARSSGSIPQESVAGCSHLLASGGDDANVILWNPDPDIRPRIGSNLLTTEHTTEVWSVAFGPECASRPAEPAPESGNAEAGVPRTWCGRWLASGSKEGNVRLWNLDTRAILTLPYQENSALSLAFSPDGRLLAVANGSGGISMWRAAEAGLTRFTLPMSGLPVNGVAFSRDGGSLASGDSRWSIKLWSLATDPPTARVLDGPSGLLGGLALSPDGKQLAAAGMVDATGGGAILLWDLRTWQTTGMSLTYPSLLSSVAYSPDGKLLATGSGKGEVLLWDLSASEPLASTHHTGEVRGVAFSPAKDVHLLASGSADGTVVLWDTSVDPKRMIGRPLQSHDGPVNCVAFSPDGAQLASGGDDGVVVLWDASFDSWRERACWIANRELTPDELHQYLVKGVLGDEVCDF